jgi:GNAT superfamily N-acetyltransferase
MLRERLKRILPRVVRKHLRRAAEFVYSDIEGVVVEKDIAASCERDPAPPAFPGEIFEVSAETGRDVYLSGLRRPSGDLSEAKARRNFANGFRGVAARQEGLVIGAVWSVRKTESRLGWVHDDLRRLRINLSDDEAYMFDMYIEPEKRGLALSTALFRAAFRGLRGRGVVRVKGYYVVGNLPALWMHRVIGYSELGRVRVRKILGLPWRYCYTPSDT